MLMRSFYYTDRLWKNHPIDFHQIRSL
jgi:hypothetical protein